MPSSPRVVLAAAITVLCAACAHGPSSTRPGSPANAMSYPDSRTVEHVDDYHGDRIADPYRWLEEIDSSETLAWIEAQNTVTFAHLDTIAQRAPIRERLTQLWNYEKFGVPIRRGDTYFYTYNDGLKNQPQVMVQDGLDGTPRVLLDPNTLSTDGTVALSGSALTNCPPGTVAYPCARCLMIGA